MIYDSEKNKCINMPPETFTTLSQCSSSSNNKQHQQGRGSNNNNNNNNNDTYTPLLPVETTVIPFSHFSHYSTSV
jgi:hypothetical protein